MPSKGWPDGVPIAAVERDTGLGKDTLRAWERRYGFPVPERTVNGERVYCPEQVARLRLIKRLIDLGHRPGKLMQLSTEELFQQSTFEPANAPAPAQHISEHLLTYLDMCSVARADELRRALDQALLRSGLRAFVHDIAGPLVRAAGEYWEHGRFSVVEEHLFSELLQDVLRGGINVIQRALAGDGPRILLTTVPEENHGLGLLMAQAIFALEGGRCISLGVQTPIDQIARAASHVDVVALSFSTNLRANRVRDGLAQLASSVPEGVEIWCGGSSPILRRLKIPGVSVLALDEVAGRLATWRAQRPLP
jgi:DNA-binding transcriptional MerR regulator/methylmalonyl-CoA mutase cobalamin-binding subunit